MNEIIMSAKLPGACSGCGHTIGIGDLIKFHTGAKTAKHVKCSEDGTEQAIVFDMWIQRAQEAEPQHGPL